MVNATSRYLLQRTPSQTALPDLEPNQCTLNSVRLAVAPASPHTHRYMAFHTSHPSNLCPSAVGKAHNATIVALVSPGGRKAVCAATLSRLATHACAECQIVGNTYSFLFGYQRGEACIGSPHGPPPAPLFIPNRG